MDVTAEEGAQGGKSVCLLFPYFDEGFIMRKVPLGLAYLAGALRGRGIHVEAYNLNVDDIREINFKDFDFVGLTCLTPFAETIRNALAHVLKSSPAIKVVLGGTHPTLATQHCLDSIPEADYLITGEGEEAICELVMNEDNFAAIPGVYYRDKDGKAKGTPKKTPDIHAMAYPDLTLFDHGKLEERNPLRPILASRGCPWGCFNCQPNLNIVQPYRLRKAESVIEEIQWRQKSHGQTYFGFIDSEFPIKKEWFRLFRRLIRERRIDFAFHCNARADLLDGDILDWYVDLGITRLAIGVESGVQRVVNEVLNKRLGLDLARRMFEAADERGIRTHAHFMIGMPGETLDDMRQTLAYARDLKATSVEFNLLTPWPGTRFHDIAIEGGLLTENDPAKFNEKRIPVITTPDFTARQVMDMHIEISRSLTGEGWTRTPDGTVFFRPGFEQYADPAPPPSARPGLRKPGYATAIM